MHTSFPHCNAFFVWPLLLEQRIAFITHLHNDYYANARTMFCVHIAQQSAEMFGWLCFLLLNFWIRKMNISQSVDYLDICND